MMCYPVMTITFLLRLQFRQIRSFLKAQTLKFSFVYMLDIEGALRDRDMCQRSKFWLFFRTCYRIMTITFLLELQFEQIRSFLKAQTLKFLFVYMLDIEGALRDREKCQRRICFFVFQDMLSHYDHNFSSRAPIWTNKVILESLYPLLFYSVHLIGYEYPQGQL